MWGFSDYLLREQITFPVKSELLYQAIHNWVKPCAVIQYRFVNVALDLLIFEVLTYRAVTEHLSNAREFHFCFSLFNCLNHCQWGVMCTLSLTILCFHKYNNCTHAYNYRNKYELCRKSRTSSCQYYNRLLVYTVIHNQLLYNLKLNN